VKTSLLALLFLTATFTSAHADVFGFKDLEGYEKCLQTDHVVETVKTDKGEQSRLLSPLEIQLRCVDSAVKLLTPSKDKALITSFIKTTKRMTAHENSLDLINLLVARSLPACNDMAIYEVLNRSLNRPRDTHRRSYFTRARAIVKRCLKDPQYRKDFLEEKDSSEDYLRANACAILLEEKLVKSCPKEADR
jgi:hypothetical protein